MVMTRYAPYTLGAVSCRPPRVWRSLALLALVAQLLVSNVSAQVVADIDASIGRLVFDVQGSMASFGENADLALSRGFSPSAQPGRGLGIGAGAHAYLLRWRRITFGLGVSVITSAGEKSPGDDAPDPDAAPLRTRFTAVAPQLSFNFGGRDGWSYVSGGVGTSRLSLFAANDDPPSQRRTSTVNYGGGARWFVNRHVALSLDLRFYKTRPLDATETEPASPTRATIMALSIGAAFK